MDFSYLEGRTTIYDFDVKGKTVLVRVDFNVPLSTDRTKVMDDTRIRESLPTIHYLLNKGAKVLLVSHFGRPKGYDPEKSLSVLVRPIQTLLGKGIHFFKDRIDSSSLKEKIQAIPAGEVILLENIRFYPEETANDKVFSYKLASLCDIFLNDAFGTMHRSHASTVGITGFIPSGLGLLPMRELSYIQKLLLDSKSPVTVVLGGGKVSTKIGVLKGLLERADHILIGGGMIFTFWKAMGYEIGNSFYEEETLSLAKDLLSDPLGAKKIVLPVDVVAAQKIDSQAEILECAIKDGIPSNMMGLDIGSKTIELYEEIITTSQTIFWNGPMGVFEVPPFDKGTRAVAMALSKASKREGVLTLVGGGESVMAAKLYGIASDVSHISTGGGALLDLLEGIHLPGIVAIPKKKKKDHSSLI